MVTIEKKKKKNQKEKVNLITQEIKNNFTLKLSKIIEYI